MPVQPLAKPASSSKPVKHTTRNDRAVCNSGIDEETDGSKCPPSTVPISQISNQLEFERVADTLVNSGITHIPVVREALADFDTPLSTYHKLANKPYTYLFESVQGGEKWGRYSIIGLPCRTIYRVRGHALSTETDGVTETQQVSDPLHSIKELQCQFKVAEYPGLPDMIGGLVGYFGYETVAYIERRLANQSVTDAKPKDDQIDAPDICLMVSTDVLVFDNLAGRVFIVTLADLSEAGAFDNAQVRLDQYLTGLGSSVAPPEKFIAPRLSEDDYHLDFPEKEFKEAVQACRDYIQDGDIMQVVLSQRLSAPFSGSALDVYRALRTINPSPYMYYLNLQDFDIVGSSPEILVRMQGEDVTVRPIAGTRKRGIDPQQDLALEKELLNDQKELAEHLMLIDLGRNDVGRIAEVGSVRLTEKMNIERYSHVMHIVSNVEAKVAEGVGAIEVLKATFPAGTVSGAPKIRAMEIINEFEPVKRGIYSGAIGYLGWNGNMDTAIAIRTAVIKDGMIYLQAGAGIVADSVPELEWKETMNKARVLVSAVNMANAGLEV